VFADPRPRSRAVFRTARGASRSGGADGNERLTAAAAAVLLVLLAVEGATLLSLRSFLSVHILLGLALVPPVALKLGSTGWRFLRFYGGERAYVVKGPPVPLMRFLVAPVLVAATTALFGTGVALAALGPRYRFLVGLHKASFVIWFGAMVVHVLAYALRLPTLVGADVGRRRRLPGAGLRRSALAASLVAGAIVAWACVPLVAPWRAWMGF
jgi:hypothetical protein